MIGFPLFEVKVHTDGSNRTDVRVVGEVDLSTTPELDQQLRTALSSGSQRVVVTMDSVDFIDAAGIGVLVEAVHAARTDGVELVLRNPSPAVARVLDILDLNGSLPIEGSSHDGF